MMPFAPGRLSTITCWPQVSVSFWATARAMMSTPPPAACGTMIRTGRLGNCCAAAPAQTSARATAQPRRMADGGWRKDLISPPSLRCSSGRTTRALLSCGAQDLHQPAHRLELLEACDRADRLLDGCLRQQCPAVAAEFVLDLGARERVLGGAFRMLAARGHGLPTGDFRFDYGLDAGQRGVHPHFHLLRGEARKLRIVVARRLELGERQRAIVQDRGRAIVGREQRFELAVVAREDPVHVDAGLVEGDAQLLHLVEGHAMLFHQVEHGGDEALYGRSGRPQPQRDVLELPAPAETLDRGVGTPAARIRLEQAPV